MKILISGAAGLVGQNLILRLQAQGYNEIIAIDKHKTNLEILSKTNPAIETIYSDIAIKSGWEEKLKNIDTLIILHAQIGGINEEEFTANNINATQNLLEAAKQYGIKNIIHISSSVINSMAVDFYTESKKAQEQLVKDCSIPWVILRPTLMFGWFDRKHTGWLARFMKKSPVFPIPGTGEYIRQPLFVNDFCDIIISCLSGKYSGKIYDITGMEEISYINLMRKIKKCCDAKSLILKIPYSLFRILLQIYSLIDSNPPFTVKQLKALVTPDKFEVINWPEIFSVNPTPLDKALDITYNNPLYSNIVLEF
jgi:nucleoside-diphosphate-sugar epimerase